MVLYDYLQANAAYYQKAGKAETAGNLLRAFREQAGKLRPFDRIQFGTYLLPGGCKPNDVKVRMPLTWFVLRKRGTKLLLLSEYSVDWEFYDGSTPIFAPAPDTTWERSSVRKWLNEVFLEENFGALEKRLILSTEVETGDNLRYHTAGGAGTKDRLFLLSAEEAADYLEGTDAAVAEMLMADPGDEEDVVLNTELQHWWLRTPGGEQCRVACMTGTGEIDLYGIQSDADEIGIRPAMWIDVALLEPEE